MSQLALAPERAAAEQAVAPLKYRSASHSPPRVTRRTVSRRSVRSSLASQIPPDIPELGCLPIFSDSTVSLTSICLNEEIYDEDFVDGKTLDQTKTD